MDLNFDRQHIWHPYSSITQPDPVFPVVKAEGAYLHLDDGRRLVDGMSSWWCALHGYNHPTLNQAIIDQVQKMSLVEGREYSELYKRCVQWLMGEVMQVYLTKAGLVGQEEELFAAYCYYSGFVLGYPRSGLIAIWEGASYEPKL